MKVSNRPTEEQALEFDGYIRHWQAVLNLRDWRIERSRKQAKDAMADIEVDECQRLATYRLGDFGGEDITPETLSKTALHETLHVFLRDLTKVFRDPRSTEDEMDAAEHKVINVLEYVLTKDSYAAIKDN